jgi:hypothetical protein
MNLKPILQSLFTMAGYLFPIAIALTTFATDEFELDTKRSKKIASYVISLLITLFYGLIMISLPVWQIVVLYLMVAISANSGYNVLQLLFKKK